MKANELRSKVMKRAWSIYKSAQTVYKTFSECLTRAWEIIKEDMTYVPEVNTSRINPNYSDEDYERDYYNMMCAIVERGEEIGD